jgi:NAD(P) transhydrogenase subunit alpha
MAACSRRGLSVESDTSDNPPIQTRSPVGFVTFSIRGGVMDFVSVLSIFVLACFVGYYVVWSVTPALHTPLMSVTNAISSVIVVGALIASAAAGSASSKWLGLVAVGLASVNIFGGFAVTARMLAMYKKRDR